MAGWCLTRGLCKCFGRRKSLAVSSAALAASKSCELEASDDMEPESKLEASSPFRSEENLAQPTETSSAASQQGPEEERSISVSTVAEPEPEAETPVVQPATGEVSLRVSKLLAKKAERKARKQREQVELEQRQLLELEEAQQQQEAEKEAEQREQREQREEQLEAGHREEHEEHEDSARVSGPDVEEVIPAAANKPTEAPIVAAAADSSIEEEDNEKLEDEAHSSQVRSLLKGRMWSDIAEEEGDEEDWLPPLASPSSMCASMTTAGSSRTSSKRSSSGAGTWICSTTSDLVELWEESPYWRAAPAEFGPFSGEDQVVEDGQDTAYLLASWDPSSNGYQILNGVLFKPVGHPEDPTLQVFVSNNHEGTTASAREEQAWSRFGLEDDEVDAEEEEARQWNMCWDFCP